MVIMHRKRRSFGLVAIAVVLSSLAAAPPVNAFLLPSSSNSCSSSPVRTNRGETSFFLAAPIILLSSTLDKQETTESSSTPSSSRTNNNADDHDSAKNVKVDPKQQQVNNNNNNNKQKKKRLKIVLVAGFESFNRGLYQGLNDLLDNHDNVHVTVFADSDIRLPNKKSLDPNDVGLNPIFARAVQEADSFIGSLIFDYDDVLAVKQVLSAVKGPRFLFECATELMEFNQVGSFNMQPGKEGPSGPPPAVKAILSKFGSGKEEDKLSGYIKLLKFGPDLLKFVPGEKASDLRSWLECYRYWNQGGRQNVKAMLNLVADLCLEEAAKSSSSSNDDADALVVVSNKRKELPPVQITPDIGLIHPVRQVQVGGVNSYFDSPASYLSWRLSKEAKDAARQQRFILAPDDAPVVAVLLYRKHVISELSYIKDLLRIMEQQGIIPVPIFINGVEAHTIVRDLLTSQHEIQQVQKGVIRRAKTFQASKAGKVDAIVNTIGFPLVGGPAGSMEAGRNVAVAEELLSAMNVPYIVASPLLLQSIPMWKTNGVLGLQSVALYSLPELDGAIDTVVLGGLVGDKIALVPERVRKLTSRLKGWIELRRKPKSQRKIAIALYGFPPNVGAVGTAALLDVPRSLELLLKSMSEDGFNVGDWDKDPDASGESLVAALSVLSESPVIARGAKRMQDGVNAKIARAVDGDATVNAALARPGAGLGGARVVARDITADELERLMGKYMFKKVRRAWAENERGPGVSASGDLVVAGLQLGNVFLFVQPLLGVEGDPMRLLFERDLTPHPQYCAAYEWLRQPEAEGGLGTDAIVHMGMHGTVEWLPGQPLGNDRKSWSDELLGDLPNCYVYAANNPSESIIAKRRGYGTLVSYNVPPYGRSGLYLELANLRELVDEYRTTSASGGESPELRQSIFAMAQRSGMVKDVPLLEDASSKDSVVTSAELPESLSKGAFDTWVAELSVYLNVLQDRLFSSGLHVLGKDPTDEAVNSYLEAYFGDRLSEEKRHQALAEWRQAAAKAEGESSGFAQFIKNFVRAFWVPEEKEIDKAEKDELLDQATTIVSLLQRSHEELGSVMKALDGGYVLPKPGGDLLRDGPSVLPTGRNIHALDPYRMPSSGAWARGQNAANEIIRQHRDANLGDYPETIAVTLWGLDAIKTRGESVAIALALVGAEPVKEGTGRIVRYDLIPLEKLGRPRIDVLATLSGIFRDSFKNIVDLLDDMFERAAKADEPPEMNFIKKHADELIASGVEERSAARLFSNPPGDYGSMVNEIVGSGEWENDSSLGETWRGRNVYSYGRNEGGIKSEGTARPEVLDKLLATTERIVQEIDSVEYGLSDIQEYYANTGALKKAAENRKEADSTGKKKKVSLSVIEAFGTTDANAPVSVKDVDEVLRLEYRSKLLNPKWRDAMVAQGSGGAYEVSQRMTAMIGWAATAQVDNFVFDQAAERYALDDEIAKKLQRSNPEAFKNVVRRLLEAEGRGMWSTNEETLDRLRELYADADDLIEQGGASSRI